MKEWMVGQPLMVDAYQAGHFLMIPPQMLDGQVSQGIYRSSLWEGDCRIIAAGMEPFIELVMSTPITQNDIDVAEEFYSDFHAMSVEPFAKEYPWPKEMFQRVVNEFDGFMPIKIEALLDGQAHYTGEPHVQVSCDVPGMGELVGWIESTMLPYLWTSATVATRGRKRVQVFQTLFEEVYPSATKEEVRQMIAYRFHDFGRRGGSASQITGIAHLINWLGTDTMDAAFVATKYLNQGRRFGACSIAAAAHRSITPWNDEVKAYEVMVEEFGGGLVSVVADSYNFRSGVEKLCVHASRVKELGGTLIVRPDSGDPIECVIMALHMLAGAFGTTEQEKGLRVLNNSAVIQGDGIDDQKINEILVATIQAGFCPSNVAFGMGEHNHKAARSDLEAAYKTCEVGDGEPVMKASNTQFKMSLPCKVSVNCDATDDEDRVTRFGPTSMVTYYDKGVCREPNFDATRELAFKSWNKLTPLPAKNCISEEIQDMQVEYMKDK